MPPKYLFYVTLFPTHCSSEPRKLQNETLNMVTSLNPLNSLKWNNQSSKWVKILICWFILKVGKVVNQQLKRTAGVVLKNVVAWQVQYFSLKHNEADPWNSIKWKNKVPQNSTEIKYLRKCMCVCFIMNYFTGFFHKIVF